MGDPAPQFRPGSRLGRYELVREIGRGGFGSVWLARLPGPGGFEQRVAIKVIQTHIGMNPTFRTMFLDEARLAANISHPNVASIYELGEEGDVLYMVMEHVQGRPLHVLHHLAQQQRRKVPIGVIVRILADTCAGLHAAHELKREGKSLGVIHRDVSPQNILVSDKGMSKLIDFGVAKANDRLAGDTSTGLAKGKVIYMAPEYAQMKSVDRRADIWSVGAVAFDLIEGRPPFDGPNDLARIYGLIGDEPAPPFTARVPAPIERVIRRALARNQEERWPTAAALRIGFEEALDACGLRVTPDTVVEWFGDSLVSEEDAAEAPKNERAMLRERLRRPQAGASEMRTIDVPVVDAPARQPDHVETLGAVSSAGIVPPTGVKRRWVPLAVAAGTAAIIGLGVVARLAQGPREPGVATSTAPAPTPAALPAPLPATAVKTAIPLPTAITTTAPITTVTPTATVELDDPRVAASRTPVASPRPRVLPKPKPTPKPRAVPSAAPTPPPRYDDTIQ